MPDWFYVEKGQRTGPVAESEIPRLAAEGRIRSDTLVWHEGMANWTPFGQLQSGAAGGQPAGGGLQAGGSEPGAVCAECRRIFPREEMIQYGSWWICAGCKPIFVQKLKEGAVVGRPGGPVAHTPGTNPLAIASLVCGIIGCSCLFVLPIVGVVTGHMALSQIRASGDRQGGRGLAIAGLVLGYIELVILAIYLVAIVANNGRF